MKVVILGGVAAGPKVAAKVRRILPDCDIELYTDDTHISYSLCGIPYYIQGNFKTYKTLLVRTPEEFAKQNIKVFLCHKAIKILSKNNIVLIKNLKNNTISEIFYDKLVISTGARPFVPDIKNINLKNIFTVRKIEDAIKIRKKALKSKTAVIIGSGYIGLEMLESLVKLGLKVFIFERNEFIIPFLDEDMSNFAYDYLKNNENFKFFTSETITEFIPNNKGELSKIKTSSGKVLETDLAIICTGVVPNVKLATNAGILTGTTGAIKTDRHMKTNIENIYACGDCTEKTFMLNGDKMWVPLGSTANKEGRIAAINLCGLDEDFEGILASTVVRCMNLTISKTGFTEKSAKNAGFTPISVIVTKEDKVGFMPNVNNIALKLTADKVSGLLLGGQAIGSIEADKRINVITSALLGRLTVEEFMQDDLTYAPPYSPTIDPLLNAANLLYEKMLRYHN